MSGSITPQINIAPSARQTVDGQQIDSGQATSRNKTTEIDDENIFSPKEYSVQISSEAREIAKLDNRDREIRAHEAAHTAVGGQYAGSPSLTYTKGPDGRSYATGGEVAIDLSPVNGDPLATLQKAEVIRSAALAPSQPSAQDLRVASKAAVMAAQARAVLVTEVDSKEGQLSDPDINEQVEPILKIDPPNNRAAGL